MVSISFFLDFVVLQASSGPEAITEFLEELPPAIRDQHRQVGPRQWMSLSFLLNYGDFHVRCSNQEWTAAAQQLAWISRQDVVPIQWWPVVLKNAEDLLANSSSIPIPLPRK